MQVAHLFNVVVVIAGATLDVVVEVVYKHNKNNQSCGRQENNKC